MFRSRDGQLRWDTIALQVGICASCYKLFELSEDVFIKWTDGQGVAGKNLGMFLPEIWLDL